MRLIVAGSRDWEDPDAVRTALGTWTAGHAEVTVVHGFARGADQMARDWALGHGHEQEPHPPDYERHGQREAPLMRNQEMADAGGDLLLAFLRPCRDPRCRRAAMHATHGTADMIRRARKAGIPVRCYYSDEWGMIPGTEVNP